MNLSDSLAARRIGDPIGGRVLVVQSGGEGEVPYSQMFANWGYEVSVAGSVAAARESLSGFKPDLTLIALGPSGADFFALVAEVVASGSRCFIVSASGDASTRVRALSLGADDWLAPTVSADELQIKAGHTLAYRFASLPDTEELIVDMDGVKVDVLSRLLLNADGTPGPSLTDTEFALLRILTRNANQLVTKDALMKGLRGRSANGVRTLDVTISRLRAKLKTAEVRAEVRSVRQLGYFYSQQNARVSS